jgi:hypothetical protein
MGPHGSASRPWKTFSQAVRAVDLRPGCRFPASLQQYLFFEECVACQDRWLYAKREDAKGGTGVGGCADVTVAKLTRPHKTALMMCTAGTWIRVLYRGMYCLETMD